MSSQSSAKNHPREKKPTGRARLSLDLDVETKGNFEAVRQRAGLGSLTDLIKRSVALFDTATDHQAKGGSLIFRHRDGREERIILL
jgi:hypothetical protein